MAGSRTVLYTELVDERIHELSAFAIQPDHVGELAVEAAISSETIDYEEIDSFISTSTDYFLGLGFFTFRKDSAELRRLGVFTTGNDYFDGLLTVEEAPKTFEAKNDLRARQLLGLASIGLVFSDEAIDLPDTGTDTTAVCFKGDSVKMQYIHAGSVDRFFVVRHGKTPEATQEIKNHFNNLRVKEEALTQLCQLRPELVGAMLLGASATKQEISQIRSISSSRTRKLKNFTTISLRPF